MARETKDFRFELKAGSLSEDGTFEGLASTYGNVDLGDDVIVAGAFTKTLQERGNTFPLLWSHDTKQPIGLGVVEDSTDGLKIKGRLNLDTQPGRDAYSNMKAGIVKGLSIGFETVKRIVKDNIRHLTEVKLFEVSACVFPMNEKAMIESVKNREAKDAFLVELDEAQAWAFRYMSMCALSESLEEILADSEVADDEKIAQADESIQQFRVKYIEMIPKLLALMAERDANNRYYYSQAPSEAKAGRRLSAATRKRVEDALAQLQTLLAEAADPSTSGDGAVMPQAETPKANVIEPEKLHSLIDSYTKSKTGALSWN